MVVFTCNQCGQSVKKNQVDTHCIQCRNCQSLSCMDCGKEFWGDEYKQHTKCITEDQKYGGKGYTPKPSSNKGEVKQEKWIEHIKNVISTKELSGPLSQLLGQIVEYSNIPRKKSKFEKFLQNSLKMRNTKLISEAWEIFAQSTANESNSQSPVVNGNSAGLKRPLEDENEPPNKKPCLNGNEIKSSKCCKCNEEGHMSQDCPNSDKSSCGGQSCFSCGDSGHMSRDCPSKSPGGGGGGGRSCFNCGEDGHMSRDCPNEKKTGGSGGGRSGGCFNCGEDGHISRDCPNERKAGGGGGWSGNCYNCGEDGHMSRDCPNEKKTGGSGGGRSGTCYNCGEDGHMSRDCPNEKKTRRSLGGRSGGCYNCGEDGHMSRDCPNEKKAGGGKSGGCFKCHQDGHMAKDCPKEAVGENVSMKNSNNVQVNQTDNVNWVEVIKRVLSQNSQNALPMHTLRKQVLAEYKASVKSSSLSKKDLKKKIREILSNSEQFVINRIQ